MSHIAKTFLASAVLLGLSATSVLAQSKVGTINIQQAIVSTKDGQKASAELQTRFDPRRKETTAKHCYFEISPAINAGVSPVRAFGRQWG